MKSKKGFIQVGTIIWTIIVIVVLCVLFKIYKHNYYNDFTKAVTKQVQTKLVRDSKVKYTKDDSYKIENIEYNDAIFYKEIDVEPNTPYRISCMVKTENVQVKDLKNDAGAMIWIMGTYEYSIPITGTKDWQKIELIFNSKKREKIEIAFRVGGNENECTGTAWFTDFKLEKGTKHTDTQWKVGCFILKNIDVNIDGQQMKFETNKQDIKNVYNNMERYKNTAEGLSDNQMSVEYEIYEIDSPITTISYENEHGYYIAPKDTKDYIYEIAKEKEFDHIFVVARMEDEAGTMSIPIEGNWVGLRSNGYVWCWIFYHKNQQRWKYRAV